LEVGRNTISTSTEATGLFSSLSPIVLNNTLSNSFHSEDSDTKDFWCDEPSSSIDSHREIE